MAAASQQCWAWDPAGPGLERSEQLEILMISEDITYKICVL